MLISCRSCQSKYTVADDEARSGNLRCRACNAPVTFGASAPFARHSGLAPQAGQASNESSQMFTLAALVGRAQATAPAAAQAHAGVEAKEPKKDSSGVIDLNALARAAEERAKRAQSEPPPSAFAREAVSIHDAAPPVRHRMKIAVIGAAAAALAIVGIAVATMGGDDAKPKAAAVAAPKTEAAPEAPKPEPVSAPAPALDAPSADARDSKADAVASAPKSGRHAHKSGGASYKLTRVSSPGAAAAAPAAAPRPKPAADPCNCHGNLQCTMRCLSK